MNIKIAKAKDPMKLTFCCIMLSDQSSGLHMKGIIMKVCDIRLVIEQKCVKDTYTVET